MKAENHYESYNKYLQQRSLLGRFYRNWILYPRLSRVLQGRVLDFGCGIGDFLRFRCGVEGADINPHNVNFCQSQGLRAELIQKGRIPFEDAAFGSVVMDNVLEHIPEAEVSSVLWEALRVLQVGGKLLIGVPGRKGYYSDDDHKCYYSEQGLVEVLGEFGCEKLKSFHMPVYMPWLESYLSQYCIYVLFENSQGNMRE